MNYEMGRIISLVKNGYFPTGWAWEDTALRAEDGGIALRSSRFGPNPPLAFLMTAVSCTSLNSVLFYCLTVLSFLFGTDTED